MKINRLASMAMSIFVFTSVIAAQEVKFVSSTLWSGMKTVHVYNNYAYCALKSGLMILDVSDISNPAFVSQLYTGGANDLFYLDYYVYVANPNFGLEIIYVGYPAEPLLIGRLSTAGEATAVFCSDSLALLPMYREDSKLSISRTVLIPFNWGFISLPRLMMFVFRETTPTWPAVIQECI